MTDGATDAVDADDSEGAALSLAESDGAVVRPGDMVGVADIAGLVVGPADPPHAASASAAVASRAPIRAPALDGCGSPTTSVASV